MLEEIQIDGNKTEIREFLIEFRTHLKDELSKISTLGNKLKIKEFEQPPEKIVKKVFDKKTLEYFDLFLGFFPGEVLMNEKTFQMKSVLKDPKTWDQLNSIIEKKFPLFYQNLLKNIKFETLIEGTSPQYRNLLKVVAFTVDLQRKAEKYEPY